MFKKMFKLVTMEMGFHLFAIMDTIAGLSVNQYFITNFQCVVIIIFQIILINLTMFDYVLTTINVQMQRMKKFTNFHHQNGKVGIEESTRIMKYSVFIIQVLMMKIMIEESMMNMA